MGLIAFELGLRIPKAKVRWNRAAALEVIGCYLASIVEILISLEPTIYNVSLANDQTMKNAVMISNRYRRTGVGF